ncbi:SH3 domain-containing protein [Streptomyces sp. NPDC046977]|uniref:SH3 domain-containing protein n=1 Tax=Streptomyces sp. NPDC046977 TaxID=3154703 RepID=UPI00340CDDBE
MRLRTTTATLAAASALLVGAGIALAPTASAAVGSSACTVNIRDQDVWPYTDGLRLRTGPGTTYSALGLLYQKDRLTARCTKGSWYYVSTDTKTRTGLKAGTYGWVSAAYLDTQTCLPENTACPYNR